MPEQKSVNDEIEHHFTVKHVKQNISNEIKVPHFRREVGGDNTGGADITNSRGLIGFAPNGPESDSTSEKRSKWGYCKVLHGIL